MAFLPMSEKRPGPLVIFTSSRRNKGREREKEKEANRNRDLQNAVSLRKNEQGVVREMRVFFIN